MSKDARTAPFEIADYLKTPEEMAAYLEACIEECDGDTSFIARALGEIAKAQGMSQLARKTGLSRESLYKALSGETKPEFETIHKVIMALGLEWHVTPKSEPVTS